MLFIVPTPIGNLGDFTYRAVVTLQEADLILAEDTRTSQKLCKHYGIETPLASYHSFNEHQTLSRWLDMLGQGQTLALISDAGTPGVSDPGFLLARACVEKDIQVSCLPGATAFVPALVMSGFPITHFHFEGFLPHKKGRKTRWDFLASYPYTLVLYESPHRIGRTIREALANLGDRRVAICREISKKFETIHRGSLSELTAKFEEAWKLKGEIVVVISERST